MSPRNSLPRRLPRIVALAASVTLAVGLSAASAGTASAASAPVKIDIVNINDFHGRLEASGSTAGAAVLAGAVDDFRAKNPNTIFASAGDNIGASTFTSFIQDDQPTLDALNAMKLDVSSVGNHEFDKGAADLTDRVIPAADFPYLAANVFDKATGKPAYDQYFVKDVAGIRVGFIGAVTEELPSLVSPAGISSITVGPIVSSVNTVADELKDGDASNGEADVIVLLVHEGAPTPEVAAPDSVFGKIVSGVDSNVSAIISAHTHQLYDYDAPVPGVAGATRPVLQTGSYSMDLGHLALSVDPDSKQLLSITSEVLPLTDAAAENAPLYPADPAVQAIVDAAVAKADVLGNVQTGTITADFNRARQSDASENRGGESSLGNFVADVQLSATEEAGAEVAFMNPGGLRADLTYAGSGDEAGSVSYKEAASVQPFANTLVTLDLTGAQIKQVLEEQWQPAAAARPFLKLGVSKSLAYTYDPAAAAGSHITSLSLNGAPLAADRSVTVVVNSFLASGGDNFSTLAEGTDVADSGKIDLQSMVDYFAQFTTASPDEAQRAVGVSFGPGVDAAAGVAAGQTVTVNLSSLLFSGGEAPAPTVDILSGGQVVASQAIDPAVVDTTDEVGRASVTFTVPATAAVGDVISASVPGTGTTAALLTVTTAAVVTPTTPETPVPTPGATGAPVLANTGAPGAESIGVGALGVLALLIGGAAVAVRRRRVVR
ncbi:bifunctional metallophosphatase/5'-nucleotidase [Subtercola boreus]|uniref:bifunctional metallophosphatase/5'-nucleotidase n=1 Tax=Subtercola boreus TaxID=120213 RepID=UPI00116C7BC9|nr:bifunctional UDP-sugar hydrolase/5'-nucleotidase [Subtercola boreus]TQL55895.1 5'-nucleotidase [Subtercola boreus]